VALENVQIIGEGLFAAVFFPVPGEISRKFSYETIENIKIPLHRQKNVLQWGSALFSTPKKGY
jgi:hypothetical protein